MSFLQKCRQQKENRIDVQEGPSQVMGRTRRIYNEINAEQRKKRKQQRKAVDINNSWV